MNFSIFPECLQHIESLRKLLCSSGDKAYCYGYFLREQVTKNRFDNHFRRIDVISCPGDKDRIYRNIKDSNKNTIVAADNNGVVFVEGDYHVYTYFVPSFDPQNTQFDFTIDGLYYDISSGSLIDVTGSGFNDLSSVPVILNRRTPSFNSRTILEYAAQVASFDSVSVSSEEIEGMRTTQVTPNHMLSLLWTPRPGTGLRFIRDNFYKGPEWILSFILSTCLEHSIRVNESVTPKKVSHEDKLKLIDVYSEYYFKVGHVNIDKKHRIKSLLNILAN